jgi:hypothetical protein
VPHWTNIDGLPRKNGLILVEDSAAPVASFVYRPTFASMDFAAVYQADFAGVLAPNDTLDPATAGANVTLSDGNLTATFAGIGTVINQLDINSGGAGGLFCCEFEGLDWTGAGLWVDFIFPYNGNQETGGSFGSGLCNQYNVNGIYDGFGGAPPGLPIGVGDILGVVFDNTFGNLAAFYVNGALQFTVGLGAAGHDYHFMLTHS